MTRFLIATLILSSTLFCGHTEISKSPLPPRKELVEQIHADITRAIKSGDVAKADEISKHIDRRFRTLEFELKRFLKKQKKTPSWTTIVQTAIALGLSIPVIMWVWKSTLLYLKSDPLGAAQSLKKTIENTCDDVRAQARGAKVKIQDIETAVAKIHDEGMLMRIKVCGPSFTWPSFNCWPFK